MLTLPLLLEVIGNLFFVALHVSSGSRFPKPLSQKEEQQCFQRMEAGDPTARAELIERNLRLVAHVIKKYYTTADDPEDLISIGSIGLIKAVSTFDYKKGAKFATYASRCIDNEILMHFRSRKKSAQEVFIDDPIDTDKDGNVLTLMDIVADEGDFVEDLEQEARAKEVREALERLEERGKEILILRYGIYGGKPLTQREIAAKLNISRSYVSRIEKKAVEKLKEEFDAHY